MAEPPCTPPAPPELRDAPARHPVSLITQHTTFLSDLPVGEFVRTHAHELLGRDEVQELLETAWVPSRGDSASGRRLRPRDFAVLIGKNAEAEPVQAALRRRGIPAVVTRGDSVLKSAAAIEWRRLLTALARPTDPTRARTAALSWFFGWSVAVLDAADDAELSHVQAQLQRWAETLRTHGTVELCAHIWSESGVTARVLGSSDGDRDLTDLDHIADAYAAMDQRRAIKSLLTIPQH